MSFTPSITSSSSSSHSLPAPAPAAATPVAVSHPVNVSHAQRLHSSRPRWVPSSEAGMSAQRVLGISELAGQGQVHSVLGSYGAASSSGVSSTGAAVAGAASSSGVSSSGAAVAGAAGTGAAMMVLNMTGVNAHIYSFLGPRDMCTSIGVTKAIFAFKRTTLEFKRTTLEGQLGSLKRISMDEIYQYEKALRLPLETLNAVLEHCSELTTISLAGYSVTDDVVIALAAKCPGLTHVYFSKCARITDAAVKALAKTCPKLTELSLDECTHITHAGVTDLAENCPKLTRINLNRCSRITDASVIALAAKCPGLIDIIVRRCPISSAAIRALTASHPRLKIRQ